MRGTLLSRAPPSDTLRARSPSASLTPQQQYIPTIRLISATPSAAGSASDVHNSFASTSYAGSSFVSVSPPLSPRPEDEPMRKKLIPKKSKLGLLGNGSSKAKERGKDLSDIVRRAGGASSSRGGFEIYVDPTNDPDLGEIVMVKKKKSRGALSSMQWGNTLDEVTNVQPAPKSATLKPKGEEKDKWWSIGRGRKDSKDGRKAGKENGKDNGKTSVPLRMKAPEPIKTEFNPASRARFNSLDSGVMLNPPPEHAFQSISSAQILTVPDLISDYPMTEPGTPDEVQTPTLLSPNPATGSIALRAMRSMRSLAHIGSWAQLKQGDGAAVAPVKKKEKEPVEPKKKKKKEKQSKEGRKATIRQYSGSSFEAGHPSPSPMATTFQEAGQGPSRKSSVLGLGLPSTMRFGTARALSVSSNGAPPPAPNRLSAGSSVNMGKLSAGSSVNLGVMGRGRSASTLSTASSLRPPSTASGNSRTSSTSATSVKWDEQGLETVKEQRRLERQAAEPRETRRTSDGRRRAALADIFPDQLSRPTSQVSASSASSAPLSFLGNPIVTIEEATADGHSEGDATVSYETPSKRRRPRPVSEQLLGKERPTAMSDDVDGVLSILDAATNDLASLISRLDLEATPGSPDGSPLHLSPSLTNLLAHSPRAGSKAHGSLVKKSPPATSKNRGPSGLRNNTASVTSLRPYAQSRGSATASDPKAPATWSRLGQQIAPWPISPTKSVAVERPTAAAAASVPPLRMTHKRTLSPVPAEEPPLVFRPLQPAKARQPTLSQSTSSRPSSQKMSTPPTAVGANPAPSSVTFGSRPTKVAKLSGESNRGEEPSPTPVFRKAEGPHVPPSLWLETKGSMTSVLSDTIRSPIAAEARKGLGLAGTLGGSVGSADADRLIESDDPDSDIPNELQVILLNGDHDRFEDTMSFNPSHLARPPPSPGSPPGMPLPTPESSQTLPDIPVFRAQLFDDEDNLADIDSSDEDTTKKSFDFTGELKALNESGASDRRSFVEQLETAFRTPAKYGLDGFGQFSIETAPPVPSLPKLPSKMSLAPTADSLLDTSSDGYNTLLPSPEISIPRRERGPESLYEISLPQTVSTSTLSKPSDGELNVNFRFGGRSSTESTSSEPKKPLTLSDIIPPPSHARSISMSSMVEEDSSVLKSIMDKAADDVPPVVPRPRLNSDSSTKRRARDLASISTHTRASSIASFNGFESFDEVRRGFEFSDNRPAFYPPPSATARECNHNVRESVFSIASVSSYGVVLNPGVKDPFDYDIYDLPARPASDDFSMSMSMSVDDTFDFIHRDSRRKRVDSDSSSFYFRAPGTQMIRPLNKPGADHRRRDSTMSTNSIAPPVSLYNRSFGAHRRNDSTSSIGSVAQAYAQYGGPAARMSWMRHRADASMDSVISDMSSMQLGRPGLGDKMLDSAPTRPGLGDKMLDSVHDYGMPLTSISASPPESLRSERFAADRSSFDYDSIMDATTNRRFSTMEDSIFEKTGHRTSVSSESLFGGDVSYDMPRSQFPGQQRYRPVSIYTIDSRSESPKREDDTMVTMFDGGHVRRRSVGSVMEGSPCVRIGKRKYGAIRGPQDRVAGSDGEVEMESPNKARLVETTQSRLVTQPSIASTSSQAFGDERMIRAKHGLLQRQSLEESCLEAAGEDLSGIFSGPIFTRPGPASRSRSSTYSSASSGADTPPLSMCDGSQSSSSESQSSIDLSQLSFSLVNMTHPMTLRPRQRNRQRGQGHRRRVSQARASRSSVYETIQEEMSSANNSPVGKRFLSQGAPLSPVVDDVMIVDASDTSSLDWDNEGDVVALRRYYALRDEAHVTVEDSKRAWHDTPFSLFAVQSFNPPEHPVGMRALLEHSQQTYGPLPSELRPRRIRSRTSSRASPYPQTRTIKHSLSPGAVRPSPVRSTFALQERALNQNMAVEGEISPYVPAKEKENQGKMSNGLPARPRVGSNARRTALGWAKRSAGRENKENKENASFGTGAAPTPGESLRISRPRPRGRPTPRAGPTPIRI